MTLAEKSQKLLEYSVILKSTDKKNWKELLPKMTEPQVKTLYDVLVEEVRSWKKEGISIIPDLAVEMQLLPQGVPAHGSSLSDLKAFLENKPAPEAPKPAGPEVVISKEKLPEPPAPADPAPGIKLPGDKSAWMLSDTVSAPRSDNEKIVLQPRNTPKIRNRVAKHGLTELKNIQNVDDLSSIEPAHLRQGPLKEQIMFIRQRLGQLAKENDMLPINIIPVFEQSPLFQTYLKAGSMLIEKNMGGQTKVALDQIMGELEGMGMDALSQQEFEAVADLKKDLEAMAGI